MIFDKLLMIAENLAYNGTPTEIDLSEAGVGKGERVRLAFMGTGLTGLVSVSVDHGNTSGSLDNTIVVPVTAAEAAKGVYIDLPTNAGRYCNISALTTASAGTYTCGIVKDGQTNL